MLLPSFCFTVHPKDMVLINDKETLEVEKDFISNLPAEMIEKIMINISQQKDIISFALASENAMVMIPDLHREITITDENIIKELLRSVEGRRVVSKLIFCINENISGYEKYPNDDEKFRNYRHGVTIKLRSVYSNTRTKMISKLTNKINNGYGFFLATFEQNDLLQEVLDKCPNIEEIKIKDDSIVRENLLEFNNFQIFGLPYHKNMSENDIQILSTKLPNLKHLLLLRNKKYGGDHAKIQVIAPNGLINGWYVNFSLFENGQYWEIAPTTDEIFVRLIVNWKSISKMEVLSTHLTDKSIIVLSETNVNLQEIYLRMHNLKGAGLDYLGIFCKNLDSVDIRLNENSTESSIKTLLHLKKIKKLCFQMEFSSDDPDYLPPSISEEGFKRILPTIKHVEDFCLDGDHLVSDYVMEGLANNCQCIQRLTLGGQRLTEVGLSRVLKATGSSLKYLNLEGCSGLNDSVMMSIPKLCVSLEELELGSLSEIGIHSRKCLDYLQSMIKVVHVVDDWTFSHDDWSSSLDDWSSSQDDWSSLNTSLNSSDN